TLDYAFWKPEGDHAQLEPLAVVQVKAEIARPQPDEIVRTNSQVRVHGAAWTGGGEITKVELSVDGGSTWSEAKLLGKSKPNAWRLWEFDWKTPATAGKATLLARATDTRNATQPNERDWNRGTYMISHLLPVTVQVGAAV